MTAPQYRVLVVDDMPAIHEDFRKILMPASASAAQIRADADMDALEAALFDDALPAKAASSTATTGDVAVHTQSPTPTSTPASFTLDSALQGRDALTCVQQAMQAGQPYALAFVDMRMPPGWDGVETIEHLWQVDPALQVVICTAYTDYGWDEVLQRLHAHDRLIILKKPFDPIEVSQLAHTLAAKWQAGQHLQRHTQALEDAVQRQTAELRLANERLQRELEQREAREAELMLAQSVFANAVNAIIVADERSGIVSVNPAFGALTGFDAAEAVGQKLTLIHAEQFPPDYYREPWQQMMAEGHWSGELWHRRKDGGLFCGAMNISRVPVPAGQPQRYVGIMADVTERRRRDEHLQQLALQDPLTGLANRTQLQARLDEALRRGNRDGGLVALLYIDLDRFKPVNDELGHDVGDALLCEQAQRLKGLVRHGDVAARVGGDEFVLLLDGLDDLRHADQVAARALDSLTRPVEVGSHRLQVGASIGVAGGPAVNWTAEALTKAADAAMYVAKAGGRCRWHRAGAVPDELPDPAASI